MQIQRQRAKILSFRVKKKKDPELVSMYWVFQYNMIVVLLILKTIR